MGEFNMHTIKRRALREAWKNPNNPFARASTFNGVEDLENTAGLDTETELNNCLTAPCQHISTSEPDELDTLNGLSQTEYTKSSSTMNGAFSTKPEQEVYENCQTQSTEQIAMERPTPNQEDGLPHTSTSISKKSKTLLAHKLFTFGNQIKNTLFNSWINILLIAAPVGIGLHFTTVQPVAIFVVNFIAIIPLAALLSYATEEIALRTGETLGGLLNATFGNAVELIVSIIALVKDEIIIVKTSLIGSILSNLLLMMGMCFFFGGLRREEQFFNITVATTAASILALAIAAIIIPSAFNQFSIANDTADTADQKTHHTASISRATAIILLFVYACYLIFQLKTHSAIYMQKSKKAVVKPSKRKLPEGSVVKALAAAGGIGAGPGRTNPESSNLQTTDELLQTNAYELQRMAEDEEDDEPNLHIGVAVGLLAGCTVVIALCAEFMVDTISAITDGGSVSAEFVGLILLPIVGNAAEHATAVTVALRGKLGLTLGIVLGSSLQVSLLLIPMMKDKMDLAIGVAVGSSMQVALLIIPLTVVLGWGLGKDIMDLSFDGFQVAVLFVSVLLVNYLISDGKSNWLEGVLLKGLYLIIAVTAWFYPITSLTG